MWNWSKCRKKFYGAVAHLKAAIQARKRKTFQLLISQILGKSSKTSIFYKYICQALVCATIPLAKINNPTFQQFL